MADNPIFKSSNKKVSASKKNTECDMRTYYYQAETNEQNSGENWSAGAEGGGLSTIASKSS